MNRMVKSTAINNPEQEQQVKIKPGKFHSLKGMKDILPGEQQYWEYLNAAVKKFAWTYGFELIATPALEFTNLFTHSIGENTDIITKEIYHFKDPGGENICLRPEFSAGIVRAYIEHGMHTWPQPVKLYAAGPVWRHDRPQAGRYRQFHQFDFEIFGCPAPIADAELIQLAYAFCSELKLKVIVQLNSLGCPDCRPNYLLKLQNFYKHRRPDLCEECKKRFNKNPLRLLDCKEAGCGEIAEEAPQIIDNLCEPCRQHFVKVLEYLDGTKVVYKLNSRIVRGLDYYSRTAFEIYSEDEQQPHKLNSLGGGGRFDYLIKQLGGPDDSAVVGFAFGVERLITQIKNSNLVIPKIYQPQIFVAQLGEPAKKLCLNLLEILRQANFLVSIALTKDGLRPQLEVANRLGVRYALIIGQKEILDGTVIIRDMENGVQEIVDYKKIVKEISKRLERDKNIVMKIKVSKPVMPNLFNASSHGQTQQ